MFKLSLGLKTTYLQGLTALDRRRELGLNDMTELKTYNTRMLVELEVDEEFARRHSNMFQDSPFGGRSVELDQVERGDVVDDICGYVVINGSLSRERLLLLAERAISRHS